MLFAVSAASCLRPCGVSLLLDFSRRIPPSMTFLPAFLMAWRTRTRLHEEDRRNPSFTTAGVISQCLEYSAFSAREPTHYWWQRGDVDRLRTREPGQFRIQHSRSANAW